MIKHYEGELGTFDYDDEEFEWAHDDEERYIAYLHYIGKGKSVDLPNGCINTRYMFSNCALPDGFTLGDKFDTSSVKNMVCMFCYCHMPEIFTLGDKFDTSNVEDMAGMFKDCTLPKLFTLGDKFYTSKVKHMDYMFFNCNFGEEFNFGNHFVLKDNPYVNNFF